MVSERKDSRSRSLDQLTILGGRVKGSEGKITISSFRVHQNFEISVPLIDWRLGSTRGL